MDHSRWENERDHSTCVFTVGPAVENENLVLRRLVKGEIPPLPHLASAAPP
jgi:hypothetical protein